MTSLLRFLTRFRRHEAGISAVEFALIAPLMLLMYLGAVDVSVALTIDRKITSTASAMADLVAQDDVITDQEMADIFAAGQAILVPFDGAPLQVRVSNVYMDMNDDVEVMWSDAEGMSPLAVGSTPSMPTGVLSRNTSVIMVEVSYEYNTVFNQLGIGRIDIAEEFYLRPRLTSFVARD
ncbi:TadE/TadG family type IV pilus assembly protein [Maricaulis sp. D1M11]|uniref:TadE/TadG family type IV pilus assembly protein n=1 Tax=Maricaulis sp. D1M11 TaxID=3076117 RepID=UPI0039B3C020